MHQLLQMCSFDVGIFELVETLHQLTDRGVELEAFNIAGYLFYILPNIQDFTLCLSNWIFHNLPHPLQKTAWSDNSLAIPHHCFGEGPKEKRIEPVRISSKLVYYVIWVNGVVPPLAHLATICSQYQPSLLILGERLFCANNSYIV